MIKKGGSGNINAESKKIINVSGSTSGDLGGVVANKENVDTSIENSQAFVINGTTSRYLDKETGGAMSSGIYLNNQDIYGLQNPPKFGTNATSKDYVHSYTKKDESGNINPENKMIVHLALSLSADGDAVTFGHVNIYLQRIVYDDITSNYNTQNKRISALGEPTVYSGATTTKLC